LLLLPLWCAAGSCIHVLHAVAAAIAAVSLHMMHLIAPCCLRALLTVAAACCMVLSFTSSAAALVAVVPVAAVVDAACIPWALYSALVGKGLQRSYITHAWHVCLAAAKEGQAEVYMVFAVCRLDVFLLYYRVLYGSKQWALSAWLGALQMVEWLAGYYIATAWCNRRAWGNKLISKCFKVSMVVQFGAIDLWGNAVRGRSKGGHFSK
jgi:hypothetical protein